MSPVVVVWDTVWTAVMVVACVCASTPGASVDARIAPAAASPRPKRTICFREGELEVPRVSRTLSVGCVMAPTMGANPWETLRKRLIFLENVIRRLARCEHVRVWQRSLLQTGVPEGHTIHRLALDHTRLLSGQQVGVSSPQGRHPDLSAVLDGHVLHNVEAFGKHLFYH